MTNRTKKVLIILGFILVVVLLAYALYKMFTATAPGQIIDGDIVTTTTERDALPGAGERTPISEEDLEGGGMDILPSSQSIPKQTTSFLQPENLTQITSDYAINVSLNTAQGLMRYYNGYDGKFYKVDKDGNITAMSDKIFYNVENVTWANTADKAVLEYPDGSNTILDFNNEKQTTLPKHWEEFTFSPQADKVGAKSIGLASENRWLVTVNSDGTGTQLIEPMGNNADKVIVDWSPSGQTVAFSKTGDTVAADRQEILFVGLNGENFKSAVVEGYDFRPNWSQDGNKVLYSVYNSRNENKPELWIVNSYGDEIGSSRTLLNINTWADKCAFGEKDVIYCAVPQTLPEGAGMAPEIADNTYDDVYRINLKTGFKNKIDMEDSHTVSDISYDKINKKIFFTSSQNNGIFELDL